MLSKRPSCSTWAARLVLAVAVALALAVPAATKLGNLFAGSEYTDLEERLKPLSRSNQTQRHTPRRQNVTTPALRQARNNSWAFNGRLNASTVPVGGEPIPIARFMQGRNTTPPIRPAATVSFVKQHKNYKHVFMHLFDVLSAAAPTWGLRVKSNPSVSEKGVCKETLWYVDNITKLWKVRNIFDACPAPKPRLMMVHFENFLRERYRHLDPFAANLTGAEVYKRSSLWLDYGGAAVDAQHATHHNKRHKYPHWLVFHPYHRDASVLQGKLRSKVPLGEREFPEAALLLASHGGIEPPNLRGKIMDALVAHNITVNSYGKYRRNKPATSPFRVSKLKLLAQHAFNICPENSYLPGYVTEKVFDALLSGVVPIWSGTGPAEPLILRDSGYVHWNTSATSHEREIKALYTARSGLMTDPPAPVFKVAADWWTSTYLLRIVLGMVDKLPQATMEHAMSSQIPSGTSAVEHYLLSRVIGKAETGPESKHRCFPAPTDVCGELDVCFANRVQGGKPPQWQTRITLRCRMGATCREGGLLSTQCLDVAAVHALRMHLDVHASMFRPIALLHLAVSFPETPGNIAAPTLASCQFHASALTVPALWLAQIGGFGGLASGPMQNCAKAFSIAPSRSVTHETWWATWRLVADATIRQR